MNLRQTLQGPTLTRDLSFKAETAILSEDDRLVELSFSSEQPYLRVQWFEDPWVEVLGHSAEEADLSVLNRGATVFFNHNYAGIENVLGIVERAWIEENRGRAVIRLSKSPEVDDYWTRVKDGTLRNVSVGYRIEERERTKQVKNGPDEFRVVRWTPLEVSLVGLPADPSVGLGRGVLDDNPSNYVVTTIEGADDMPLSKDETATADSGNTPNVDIVQVETKNATLVDAAKMANDARAEERARIQEITRACRKARLSESFADDLITRNVSLDSARAAIIDALTEEPEPQTKSNHKAQVQDDQKDRFLRGATTALLAKAGRGEYDTSNEFNGWSLREILRESLRADNVNSRGMSDDEMLRVVKRASGPALIGEAAFTNLMSNVASHSLMQGWDENPGTWSEWMQVGSNPDFKAAQRSELGGFDNLALTPRGGEVKYQEIGDRGETISIGTYANKVGIDRQTIIDDSVSAFANIAARWGEAAARTVNETAYAPLFANAAMAEDAVALFNAAHNNLQAASAVTTASVTEMRQAMAIQTRFGVDSGDAHSLNLDLAYVIVPRNYEGAALTTVQSEREITASSRANTTPNIERQRFQVVADAILDNDSTTNWYGAAARQTIEVAFLNGRRAPTIVQMDTTNILGVEWLVYIDCGAAVMDFRGLQMNGTP